MDGTLLGPEVVDLGREPRGLGRLLGVMPLFCESLPELRATGDRKLEVGPDVSDVSHTEINA